MIPGPMRKVHYVDIEEEQLEDIEESLYQVLDVIEQEDGRFQVIGITEEG
jgi:hypothetical protein